MALEDIMTQIVEDGRKAADPMEFIKQQQAVQQLGAQRQLQRQRQQQADNQQAAFELNKQQELKKIQRQDAFNAIQKNSATSEEFITNLTEGGFLEKAQAFKAQDAKVKKDLAGYSKENRIQLTTDMQRMASMAETWDSQETYQAGRALFARMFPDSELDDDLPDEWSPELTDSLKAMGKTAFESWKQDNAKTKADLARRRVEATEAGLDIRRQEQKDRDYRTNIKTTTGLRKEYTIQTKEIAGALSKIEQAERALESNTPLDAKMAQALLSQLANSKVRALAELAQYKNFGTLWGRITGGLSKFVLGRYNQTQVRQALGSLSELKTMYQSMEVESKGYFRYLASKGKVDSHSVAPYKDPDDIFSNKYLSDEQKVKIAEDVFPEQFK